MEKRRFWGKFGELKWLDWFIDFLFRLTAKCSELLLGIGVILSTADHFQHGALFDGNSATFTVWAWMQAIGFEASAGVVLAGAIDANKENDKIKRNILLVIMTGLAVVGTVMLIMALVEAATSIKESSLPIWYGIPMSIFRGVVSVAYVTVGRVKDRRFSGIEPGQVQGQQVQDRLAELVEGFGKQIEQVQSNLREEVRRLVQEEVQKVQGFTTQEVQRFTTELREEVQGFIAVQGSLRTEVQGFITEQVQEGFSTVQGSLHAEVQGVHEQVRLMVQSVSSQRQEVHVGVHTEQVQMSIEQLLNGFNEMRTELASMRTLVTEVQGSEVQGSLAIAERSVANTEPRQGSRVQGSKGSGFKGSNARGSKVQEVQGSNEEGSRVQEVQGSKVHTEQEILSEPMTEVNSGDIRSKVRGFIREFQKREQRIPTLPEIMNACDCGKSTASTYRSEILGLTKLPDAVPDRALSSPVSR